MKLFILLLYYIATFLRNLRPINPAKNFKKVVHISPTNFNDKSVIGGGERYSQCLAIAMAELVETVFVTFGEKRYSLIQEKLKIEIYPAIKYINNEKINPLNYTFLQELFQADAIHCHQYYTVVNSLAILGGAILGKPVFVTDYGGWSSNYAEGLNLSNLVSGFLPISSFSQQNMPQHHNTFVIYGGVSQLFTEAEKVKTQQPKVLYVGRIRPHKGINYLIDALEKDVPLYILGRVYHERYFSLLQNLANGKQVHFITDASDSDIIEAYRTATVTILPSVYTDVFGTTHKVPELLGLVLLESMACGTPVICSAVGAMPEIVEDGVSGFVVPPNDPVALKERINWLIANPEKAEEMGRLAKEKVLQAFTWEKVALKCLEAYNSLK